MQQRIALRRSRSIPDCARPTSQRWRIECGIGDRLQADLEPAMKHMAHVSDAQEILRGLAVEGTRKIAAPSRRNCSMR